MNWTMILNFQIDLKVLDRVIVSNVILWLNNWIWNIAKCCQALCSCYSTGHDNTQVWINKDELVTILCHVVSGLRSWLGRRVCIPVSIGWSWWPLWPQLGLERSYQAAAPLSTITCQAPLPLCVLITGLQQMLWPQAKSAEFSLSAE